jgi:NAD+ synthase
VADIETVVGRDPQALRTQLVTWLREQVEGAHLKGAIFGLSGGIDSAVVCALAAEALGPEHCMGLVIPIESHSDDAQHACEVATTFGVEALTLDLTDPFQQLFTQFSQFRERAKMAREVAPADPSFPSSTPDSLARANLKPRLRMMALYYYANLLGYLVVGTGNRDEFEVGYFTKHGDGGADVFPLGDLVKGEVRALARELGVPTAIIERAPSAGLWPGQTDESELGFAYDDLDRYLLEGSSGDERTDAAIAKRAAAARHKIAAAPVARPT